MACLVVYVRTTVELKFVRHKLSLPSMGVLAGAMQRAFWTDPSEWSNSVGFPKIRAQQISPTKITVCKVLSYTFTIHHDCKIVNGFGARRSFSIVGLVASERSSLALYIFYLKLECSQTLPYLQGALYLLLTWISSSSAKENGSVTPHTIFSLLSGSPP